MTRTLETLDVVATEDLAIELPGLSVDTLIGRAIERTHAIVSRRRPHALIVEGESTTVLGASLAAFHEGVMVAHVCSTTLVPHSRASGAAAITAMNARVIAQLAHLHFVPGAAVSTSLLHQGVDPHSVVIVGSPAIDNLRWILRNKPGQSQFASPRRHILVVLRQSEFVTTALDVVTKVTARLASAADVEIVVPIRHRLVVRSLVEGRLGTLARVRLTNDLDYRDYVATLEGADLVLTDSPSVQAEAQALRKPCVRTSDDQFDDDATSASDARGDADGGLVTGDVVVGDPAQRVEAVFAQIRRLLDDEEYDADVTATYEAGLGGLAANSMELRLRAELESRVRSEGRRGESLLGATSGARNNGRAK